MSRVQEKISEISQYLDELEDILPQDFGGYKNNLEKKAACERYVEKIVEAMTDLAFFVIKQKKFRKPEDDADAFAILCEQKIIDDRLASNLKSAKGMKNIISHQYGKIDDLIVFEAITHHLPNDAREFLKRVQPERKSR